MKLKFSTFDRVVAGVALRNPWIGGEDGVLTFYELGVRLRTAAALKAADKKPFDSLSRTDFITVELAPKHVEALAFQVAGGSQSAVAGEVGPFIGEFLSRLRAQAPRPVPKTDETKGSAKKA